MSKINYDLERIKGIVFDVDGVLSPSTIPMDSEGMPSRMVNIKDGYALQLAVKLGYKIAIITGGYSPAIKARFNGLGITDIYMKAGKKIDVLKQWMDANGLLVEEVAYVGDDIPPVNGGYGVARDLLEEIMRAQGKWMTSAKAFGW